MVSNFILKSPVPEINFKKLYYLFSHRAASLEPEGKLSKPKEHIIPIRVEDSCQARPPVQPLQQQRSMSQR